MTDNLANLMGMSVVLQVRIDGLKAQLSNETVDLMVAVRIQELQHSLDILVDHLKYMKYVEEHESNSAAFNEYVKYMEADNAKQEAL